MKLERLLYISQQTATASHADNILAACEAGCRWIQLRVKSGDASAAAFQAMDICRQYGAMLTINDHPDIAKTVGAHGVHVGLQDMPVAEARAIAGPQAIIGGTANTPEDVLAHAAAGADYVGYGPFRFTTTKEKLSPVLGLAGYNRLMATRPNVPIIAIGGILLADIPALLDTGVYGIAVSGLITHAPDKKSLVQQILDSIWTNS
ncbi:thiamine phosphate synthase [Chitinophaga rhizosphaerae]|uniref:thiamine phosphate synthase n=1 Tax=Chitinophaga rhizosphaerae TaxID=1864947 RepID=UPI000F8132A6